MKPLATLLIICMLSIYLPAQNGMPDRDDYLTTGTAFPTSDNCFQLTPNQMWQGGTVWYKNPISLNDPFEMELDLKFGCDDQGADGMVFIFHPKLKDGFQGEGIGFGGLKPSFGIEMDTYENPHLADPHFDHLAVMKNGEVHHHHGITEPIPLLSGNRNIEDCKAHRVKITWTPSTNNLRAYIDGDKRLDTSYDIINKIFRGKAEVFWGISSATGGEHNQHLVCFEKLDFTTLYSFDKSTKHHISSGQEYTLKNLDFRSGKTNLPEVSYKELDKLVNLMKEKPNHHVFINGHTDNVGSASQNKSISKKRADEVARYLIEKGISKDRIETKGHGEDFPKVKNNSPQNRKVNRRVDILLMVPRA